MEGWQADLAPHTSRGGRATDRQAQAELSRLRSGRQQGRGEERGGEGGALRGRRRPRRAAAAQTPSARRSQSVSRPPIPTRAHRTIPSRVSSGRARWAVAEAAVGAYLPCVLVSTVYNPQVGAAHRAKSSGALLQYYPRSIRLLEEARSRGEYVAIQGWAKALHHRMEG